MQNGQLIIGYHPFYRTPTSVQVATLNADRKSSTPYPAPGSVLLQSCRNADGSFLPPKWRYDFASIGCSGSTRTRTASSDPRCLSTEKATGAGAVRPAAPTPSTWGGTLRPTRCSRSSTWIQTIASCR